MKGVATVPRRGRSQDDEPPSRSKPATTPEAREQQMIELADALAERQLREGSASSQVITHYLKLGSSRERLEQERLQTQIQLDKAKADQIAAMESREAMFAEAIKAMSSYQGNPEPAPYDDSYDGPNDPYDVGY